MSNRVLVLACSLRQRSLNRLLAAHAAKVLAELGAEVDLAALSEFPLPLFDQDLIEDAGGAFPAAAEALKARFLAAPAFVLATPEYNYSIAAPLKNAIDWLSRYRPMPFRGKTGLLMSASTSVMGGIRGLWQTRIPLEGCGALVVPDMFILPQAQTKLDATAGLTDAEAHAKLVKDLSGFLGLVGRVAS